MGKIYEASQATIEMLGLVEDDCEELTVEEMATLDEGTNQGEEEE